MSNAILAITDGTLRYSLITRPWWLEDWIPQNPPLKGGGIRRGSPLSDGTRLVDFSYANVIDTFMLKVMHGEQDGAIRNLQDMKRLLEKGRRYWTDDWATEPVWIEARGSDETNIRYAVIKDWSLPRGANPYAQPFYPQQQEAVMEGLPLTLEHDFWQADEPGTGTDTEISAQQDYNAVTYGRAQTTAEEVYVANRHNEANITHIFTWTSPAGPFSGNLIGAGLPFDIFNGGAGGPANGDITYFGINTALADSGPFSSLVFDILTPATYGAGDSVAWEYWNGAWVALTIVDNTASNSCDEDASFDNIGVNSIHWEQPSDWATVAVNAITGYWVRLVITEATGITRAQQRNRNIYSVVWPEVSVDKAIVLGDIPALLNFKAEGMSDCLGAGGNTGGYINRVMVGVRSASRDATGYPFRAFLNFADEQNPDFVTASADDAAAFATNTEAPSGRCISWAPAGIEPMAGRAHITFANVAGATYAGSFHAFLRYQVTSGSDGDIRLFTHLENNVGQWTTQTEEVDLLAGTDWNIVPLGLLRFPAFPVIQPELIHTWSFHVSMQNTVAVARTVYLFDLILIPADEWLGDFQENITPSSVAGRPLSTHYYLDVDPLSLPKRLTSWVIFSSTSSVEGLFVPYTAASPILQANTDQRLYFFMSRNPSLTTIPRVSEPFLAMRVWCNHTDRYQSMRGAR